MTTFTCEVCPRAFTGRNARAQHERRSHPDWQMPDEVRDLRRREVKADYLDRNSGAVAASNRRYREAHPDRAAASAEKYRETHRAEARESTRRWRATPAGRAAAVKARHQQVADGKHSARMALHRAVKAGQIVPEPCIRCGATPAEGHHYLGYAREHWLHVVWLCDLHHARAHAELRQELAS